MIVAFIVYFLSMFNSYIDTLLNNKLPTGWYYIVNKDHGFRYQLDSTDKIYYLDSTPIITVKNIQTIYLQNDSEGEYYLKMKFDTAGTKSWQFATMKSINSRLGFIFNNKLIQAPIVNTQIDGGIAAIWDYNKEALIVIKKSIEHDRKNILK